MAEIKWQLSGDYFENCNCSVVCPCLVSTRPPLTSQPTQGDCHVAMIFHIDKGRYGDVPLDGMNVALIAKSQGAMANGNMTGAAYIDERADEKQTEALGAIFSGGAGGPGGPPTRSRRWPPARARPRPSGRLRGGPWRSSSLTPSVESAAAGGAVRCARN